MTRAVGPGAGPTGPIRADRGLAGFRGTKKSGEGRSCSSLMRGRKENDVSVIIAGIRPRSPGSIAILPVSVSRARKRG